MKTSLKILLAFSLFVYCSNINAQNFFESIQNGEYKKVEQLIQNNPGWIDSTSNGYSPLVFASYFGKDTIVEFLIKHGADMYKVNPNDSITPLHFATLQNNLAVVEVLISNGMDVNVKDKNKKTAIIDAIENNKKEMVELLLKKNAKLPEEKEMMDQILHSAVLYRFQDISEKLIKNKASLSSKDNKGRSLLLNAVIGNNLKMVDLLLEKNAKLPDEKELINEALHAAVLYGFEVIAEKLVKNRASLLSIDKNGRSLLHIAVIGENLKWIDLLIAKHLDINKLDNFNRSPLHYSVEQGQFDITKLLLLKGAKINMIACTNRTPLNIAQDLGHIQLADFLKSKGGTLSDPKIFKITGEENKKSEIKVTYIANMGVLISSASKNILIDALFDNSYNVLSITPKNIVSKINKFEAPFNSIDLILITHYHGDHFTVPMVADYLSINKTVKVVCSNITSSALKNSEENKVDTSRIVAITPELYKSIDTMVNDIKIKILRLRHSDMDGQEENLGFIIDMEGVKVFHSGDSGGNVAPGLSVSDIQEYDSIGIEKMKVDLAILNRGSLWDSTASGIQIIKKFMKPKHIILSHFSEDNKQGEWDGVDQAIKQEKGNLPEITLFKWPMQNIIIRKGL